METGFPLLVQAPRVRGVPGEYHKIGCSQRDLQREVVVLGGNNP